MTEIAKGRWDARNVQLVMTTRNRRELLDRTLASLAKTRLPCTLWLVDDASDHPISLHEIQNLLSGGAVLLGGLLLNRERRRQAGAFNQGYALATDYLRQERHLRNAWLAKLEDDFEFNPEWLTALLCAWLALPVRSHNVGMLGAANGESGEAICRLGPACVPERLRERYDIGTLLELEVDVVLCQHVAAGCMFSSVSIWEDLMPIPPRPGIDADVMGDAASGSDWFLTGSGMKSITSRGMVCARIIPELLTHIGDGASTWRKGE